MDEILDPKPPRFVRRSAGVDEQRQVLRGVMARGAVQQDGRGEERLCGTERLRLFLRRGGGPEEEPGG